MTVDVKGGSPLWLKVKDLAEGVTYRFRIRAKTFTYGPEIEANVTTGPGEGRGHGAGTGAAVSTHGVRPPKSEGGAQSRAGAWRCRGEQDGFHAELVSPWGQQGSVWAGRGQGSAAKGGDSERSCCSSALRTQHSVRGDAGLVPGVTQWVNDPTLP